MKIFPNKKKTVKYLFEREMCGHFSGRLIGHFRGI